MVAHTFYFIVFIVYAGKCERCERMWAGICRLKDLSEYKFDVNMYLYILENYKEKTTYNSLKL